MTDSAKDKIIELAHEVAKAQRARDAEHDPFKIVKMELRVFSCARILANAFEAVDEAGEGRGET